jgi:thioredoxin reductase (NADPH)
VARHFGLRIYPYHEFVELEQKNGSYTLRFRHTVKKSEVEEHSRNVVIATGFYDVPKLMNVPGEDLPHVSHYYREAFPYHGQDVVIIGAGNSAVEAALDIYRNGGQVTMIHRGEKVKKGVKYWILPDILNRIREKSIRLIANARVLRITEDTVEYERKGQMGSAPADQVLALTGYQPDRSVLQNTGAAYNTETLEPRVNEENFESSRPGLYFAGSMLAGIYPNRIFIENARKHGEVIIKHIVSKNR